jgi:hypothetical protein
MNPQISSGMMRTRKATSRVIISGICQKGNHTMSSRNRFILAVAIGALVFLAEVVGLDHLANGWANFGLPIAIILAGITVGTIMGSGSGPSTLTCGNNHTHTSHFWQNPHDGDTYWCPGHKEVSLEHDSHALPRLRQNPQVRTSVNLRYRLAQLSVSTG